MTSDPSLKAASGVGPVAAANDRGPTTSAEMPSNKYDPMEPCAVADCGRPRKEHGESIYAIDHAWQRESAAPWVDPLDRAVENVEQHQRCGFFHPYTCGNPDHDWRQDDGWTTLKPEKRGGDIWLVCSCGYEQRLTAMDGMMIEGVRQAGDPLAEFRKAATDE